MEPENNMENKIPVNNVSEEITPEMEAMAAEEVVVTEAKPVADETPKDIPKGDIAFNDKPKKKTGMILCMILLFLIAAGGVGFGVWAWMDGNSQRDNLNAQINSLKEQNSKLLEQLGEEDEEVIIDVETGTNSGESSNINPEDYIYIGEWGIKIKIEGDFELIDLKRLFTPNYLYKEGDVFLLSAASKNLLDKFKDEYYMPGVHIFRTTNSVCYFADRGEKNPVYNDGSYNYCIYAPATAAGQNPEHLNDEIMQDWGRFNEILSNSQNYSKI